MEARNGEKLSTRYEPKAIEKKWSDFWEAGGYFHSEPDGRKPYTIVIPPPNVTGAHAQQYAPGCIGKAGPYAGV